MNRAPHLSCLLLLMLTLALTSQAQAQSAALDVAHYRVDLALEPERGLGQVTLLIQVAHAGSLPLVLDHQGTGAVEVTDARGRPLEATRHQDKLHIQAPACLQGPCSLTLRYQVEGPALSLTGERAQALFHTRAWMISHDEPSDRATWTLRACLPASWGLVASGLRQGAPQRCGDRRRRHTWRSQGPLAPFLMGFVAGPLRTWATQAQGVRLEVAGPPHQEALARPALALTPQVLGFLQRQAGAALPRPVYTQVITPGRDAQEMGGFAALGDFWLGHLADDPDEDWLVVHELAHQWWGVSLTMRDWSHFWLHEGVASYMVAAWKEHRHGPEAYQREVGLWRHRLHRLERAGRLRPLVDPSRRLSSPGRRPVDYWLGALVLHRLRAVLGREAFARGLADFTRSHLGQPVDSEDLRRSMERASQANLEGFFARWVYGAAPPRVQARVQAGPRSVTLRVTSDHEAAHGPLPLTVELEDAQGARRFTLALRPGAQTATWGHHPPLRALRVDPDHTLPWLTLNE